MPLRAQARAIGVSGAAFAGRRRHCRGQLGQTADGKQILLATCTADSLLLLELGRLRELTFRQVGEGTGAAATWTPTIRSTSTS